MQMAMTDETGVIVEYGITDAAIAELRERLGGLKIVTAEDYKTVAGAIAEVRTLRVGVDKKRKELKADAMAWGKKVDVEAKRITEQLVEIEGPLKLERTRVDDEKEAEKALLAQQKQDRIDELRGMVESIRILGNSVYGKASDVIEVIIDQLQEIEITDESYEEYAMEAKQVMNHALATASEEHQTAVDREEEAARQVLEGTRLEEERQEQARLRKIQDDKYESQQADIKKQQDALDLQAKTLREAGEAAERKKREDAEKEQCQEDLKKAEAQREKDAEAALLREEALRPDKEKLLAFADTIDAMKGPDVESAEASDVISATLQTLGAVSKALRTQCAAL